MTRTELYPSIEPFRTGRLDVDDLHSLHYEECGRADGIPVLFVHGGPGAGCFPDDRRFFDPEAFRIVLVDQRGCGKSTPHGELEQNTTDLLVADFERLRAHLGIDRWHVFGGSWGSTLGLYYAQRHPERCASLVLRGIWLFRQVELDWWFYGLRQFRPEMWERFAAGVDVARRDDLLDAYWELLIGDDRDAALAAARRWSVYEGSACTLRPNPQFESAFQEDGMAWSLARLEAHYFRNQRFSPDDRLLRDIDRVRTIPGFIVHGRYDLVCPFLGAHELAAAWPEAELAVVQDAGHSSREPGTAAELVGAMERIKATGRPERSSSVSRHDA